MLTLFFGVVLATNAYEYRSGLSDSTFGGGGEVFRWLYSESWQPALGLNDQDDIWYLRPRCQLGW